MKQLIGLLFILQLLSGCSSDMEDSSSMENDDTMNMEKSMKEDEENAVDYQCGDSDHPKVNQLAILSTLHHGVMGQVKVEDNCTLSVSSFSYDGEGPAVYFYGGIDGDYEEKGFAIGEQLNGKVYDNDSFTINLDSPNQLDNMNGISVWCHDFAVSFGDGLFI
jgi:uncharacterized protein YceK